MLKSYHPMAVLTCSVIWLLLLGSACQPQPALVGKWRSEPPASLLFEYLADGSVLLLDDSRQVAVFHYKIIDHDSLQLFDGQGRLKQYDFQVSGDTLTFYDQADPGIIAARYHREK